MLLRVKCPRCGRLEEYTPTDEEVREAREKGLASISFFHGDHTLVIYFDMAGSIRRSIVLRSVGAMVGPAMPFDDLRSLMGDERLALVLAALTSGGRVILASSSLDTVRSISQALAQLVAFREVLVKEVVRAEELKGAGDEPEGTMLLAEHALVSQVSEFPAHVLLADLEVPLDLSRDEKALLGPIIDVLGEAGKLKDEASKISLVRDRLSWLREVMEKVIELVGDRKVISEAYIIYNLYREGYEVEMDHLELIYYMLDRFRDFGISKRLRRDAFKLAFRA